MIDDDEDECGQKKQGWKKEPHTTRPWELDSDACNTNTEVDSKQAPGTSEKMKVTQKETKKPRESERAGDASSTALRDAVSGKRWKQLYFL